MRFLLTSIEWDTDDEDVELPSRLEVEVDTKSRADFDAAVSAASDKTGWGIVSCVVSPVLPGEKIADGYLKRIHVNQHVVRANKKNGSDEPVLTIKARGKTYTGRKVRINGPSTLVQAMDKPLSCGAHIWIETHAEVVVE